MAGQGYDPDKPRRGENRDGKPCLAYLPIPAGGATGWGL